MKKQLLISALTLGIIGAKAQTNVEVKWSLTSDGSATINSIDPTAITVASQVLGSSITAGTVTYGQAFENGESKNWQKLPNSAANAFDANFYVEYKITASESKHFQLNQIKLDIVGSGGTTNRLVAAYSTDNFATSNNIPVAATYNYIDGTPPTFTQSLLTQADPLSLINANPQTATPLLDRIYLTIPLQINILPTKTLSVRLYLYQTGTGNRFTASRNVVFIGKTDDNVIPLPLNFLSFTAQLGNDFTKNVNLKWTTTNEVNTDYFSIEKNTGKDFESIGTLKSNNISGINQYTYTDLNRNLETAYYRIKQVDLDGKSSYSNTISVKPAISYTYYPNPAKDYIIINGLAKGKNICSLHTISGKQLRSWQFDGNLSEARIDLSDTNSQVLFLKIKNEQGAFTHKIIKE
ncbi:hypothetical protein Pedsa_2213 [Pseudopedobacter saltans DSM 12145]|uniref:Secretion system C-terminal sorting domain-containing protein n=1 Tax=Pseudopedobacter saltans (strain ATCC 51119 / DSM 12145 / JCM 21818 / CCUG 39354 / LMG 10337 / NBRC 100064 / NCIMB 13643) TaxID=762903 RepID=F0SBS4_PSESL|nr:T9SS type A sorting domain-containing protein [Pseudopedobacter saltans]ADY52765.1 hypothetical protein Pedsa_2213 [Pseudopedobacter saltans DSM 12145]